MYARALDSLGSVIEDSSFVITNIIEVIITISDYELSPTNKDITVTASTNMGTLNETSHVFTKNGSFDFIATDESGNITKKTVTVTNIDKIAPTKPLISIDVNNLSIASGKDNESGVKETLYQINDGSWMIYSNSILLEDGTYVIMQKW